MLSARRALPTIGWSWARNSRMCFSNVAQLSDDEKMMKEAGGCGSTVGVCVGVWPDVVVGGVSDSNKSLH